MADAFHGYYTLHFQRAGQIAGMLSVNGSSGQVWFHSWHGGFIQSRDLGALKPGELPVPPIGIIS